MRGLYTSLGKKVRRVDRFAEWLERALRHYAGRHGMPDVLNAHCATPAGWAALEVAGKVQPRPRVVLTEHTGPFELLLADPEIAERTLAACRDADAICAVGYRLRDDMAEAGVTRAIEVIPNPVSSSFRFADLPPAGRAPDGRASFTGLFVGTLLPTKGIAELARAIERLADDGALDLRWEIFGEGPEQEALSRVFASGPARGKGTLHGVRSKEEIARVMRTSHFLALPSYYENCPLAVVEALSMGRPVVGTRGTGMEFYVLPGDGILCEPKSVEDLERAIRELVQAPWDARAIAARAAERFSPETIATQYARLFGPTAGAATAAGA